jgi:hypothetical protein
MKPTLSTLLSSSVLAIGVSLAASTLPAQAVTFGFTRITNNNVQNPASQFLADVTDLGGGMVQFKISNSPGIASAISEFYLADSNLPSPPQPGSPSNPGNISTYFQNGPVAQGPNQGTVQFTLNANVNPVNPADLPGGNTVGFVSDQNVSSEDVQVPANANRINPGEFLILKYNLLSGVTFNDVMTDLESGLLRMGLHVQSIGTQGGSDSFVNNQTPIQEPEPAPEPGTTAALGLFALGGLALLKKKRADS